MLHTFTSIPSVWITPIWLLFSAAALYLLMMFLPGRAKGQSEKEQTANSNPAGQPGLTSGGATELKNADEFYRTYDNALLIEIEGKLRENAERYHSGVEREKFLLRTLSTMFLIYVFDSIWFNIFGSQLRALQELNSKPLKVNELRRYYDPAVAANPNFFVDYDFDRWLRFLFSWVLLSQKLDVVEITVRGREFLKYLVHNGRPLSERSN